MLWLVLSAAHAADITPRIEFERYTLANGLEVILSVDHHVPLVAVDTWYHVGGGNEVPGRSGFAHLFEHIMFQGSRNVPEDTYFQFLEGAGATMVNGTTDFDRTNYFETLPSNQLDLALWLESDRLGFLLDTLTQERLDNQIGVVRKERQQSTENVPYGMAQERFFQLLFPEPHPYHGVVIGSHEDLEHATLEDVRNFFKTYYVPNNATLVIVGDFEPSAVKALVEKYYGPIPKAPPPPGLVIETDSIKSERREAMTDEVELPMVSFGWITSLPFEPGDAELTLGASILGNGKASRLYTALVHDQQIAAEVNAYQYDLLQGSVFGVDVKGKPGVTVDALEKATWAVIETMSAAPPTPDEVAGALRKWQARTLRGLELLGGFGGKADVLNYYNQMAGDPDYLPKDFARMAAVTPDGIHKTFADQIRADNRVVVTVTPKEKAVADAGGAK
jgi:zinc protease